MHNELPLVTMAVTSTGAEVIKITFISFPHLLFLMTSIPNKELKNS